MVPMSVFSAGSIRVSMISMSILKF
ncbi:hypothetical protein Gogos_002572 [Gossypium gossypioides]|uniref:Uncharacterized protein n=1 Tax=Gossypium gossypioides TaxID=34282 RepID=A0A7J9CJB8_GOSGO|nr:hypothetical protein [Gossypium gossypioides]